MENLDPLLKQQIDELIGDQQEIPERLNDLLAKVSETYDNLRQQTYRHKLVCESFPAFVFIASPDLEEIYYANRKLEEQFELDRDNFYQDPVGCLQESVPFGEKIFEEVLEVGLEKPLASEFKLNGDQWLRVELLPWTGDGGKGKYLVGIFHDVTTEKKTKDSLLENIVEQREIIFNKMPGLLQKNIALVKNRLRDMYHRKEEEKEDGEDCKHCLVWVQAVDIAYENIRHHSESAEVDMFSYVKQLCQYVMSLHQYLPMKKKQS